MAGPTRLICNSALRHVTMFKAAVMQDIIISVLLMQTIGVVAINTTKDYNLVLLASYCFLWSALFSRHAFRIMPSTKKRELFLFGIVFLFMALLLSVLADFAIGGILVDGEATNILKMIVASSIISIILVYAYPSLLSFVILKEHKAIRSGSNKKPYYMFKIYFLVFFCMILVSRFISNVYDDTSAVASIILEVTLCMVLFFSAIVVASLIFAVYKKGHLQTL